MTRRSTISAVIISCNEVDVIEPCLQSVKDWVDEIVVVDMYSTDGTRETVQRYSARLVDHERLSYGDPARDFAFAQASGDWIVMLDPDERVPEPLAHELRHIADEDAVDVVYMHRKMMRFGRPVTAPGSSDTGTYPRFFRRGTISWPPEVHGAPDTSGLRARTLPAQPPGLSLQHDTWRTVAGTVDRILRYAPEDVANLQARDEHFSLGKLLYAVCEQVAARFLLRRGYEDGMAGLLTALYDAVYQLTIHAELWEAEGRTTAHDPAIRRWGRRIALPLGSIYALFWIVRRRSRPWWWVQK